MYLFVAMLVGMGVFGHGAFEAGQKNPNAKSIIDTQSTAIAPQKYGVDEVK